MIQLVDTHTHLYLSHFDDDRQEVIQRALDAGVNKMILPNIDKTTITPLYQTIELYPGNLFPAMGLHPNSIKDDFIEELKLIEREFEKRKFYAVGEIGIDLYRDRSSLEKQIEVFRIQLGWAKQLELPVIIHTRDSFDVVLEVLQQENTDSLRGVIHCFTGSYDDAIKIRSLGGFYIGIGGILTFKNSKLADSIRDIPMEMILLETDSPFLTPHPYRGKRNESSYITLVAQKLAQIKNLPVEQVAKITTSNANKLFGLS